MDAFHEMDFSNLCFNSAVSIHETNPASSDSNNILYQNYNAQDIDYAQLFFNTPASNVETIPKSTDNNDILDLSYTNINFSPFLQDILGTKSNTLSCPETISNDEVKSNLSSCVENDHVSNNSSKPASSDHNDKEEIKVYTCLTCNKTFPRARNLKRHILIHERKKKDIIYTCSTCEKTFSRNCNLQQHMQIHEKPTIYRCSVCDKTFRRNYYLNQHMSTHSKENLIEKPLVYDCSTCGKIFSDNNYLSKHMKMHARGKSFSCEVCLKAFTTKAVLKRHQLLHNIDENMQRSFKCEHCGYMCMRNDQLTQHIRCYQNSTYACSECKQKFCRRNDLIRHSKECPNVSPELATMPKQNPYSEKVKHFLRKNELKICSTTTFENCENTTLDLKTYLFDLTSSVENEMKYQFFEKNSFKCTFTLEASVSRSAYNEESESSTLYLNSNTVLIFSENMINKTLELVFRGIMEQYLQLEEEWKLFKVIKLHIFTTKINSI